MKGAKRIAIKCTKMSDEVLAVLENPTFFDNRKEEICAKTFGTKSITHPKIERIYSQPDTLISGESMKFYKRIQYNDGLDQYRLTPEEIYKIS